ncbi:MAG: Hsp70 family protein [Candidatus Electryoneaceae bacterium]|nr:Hsp70 family protein [Candidatus Electryoneaceae bacterium]
MKYSLGIDLGTTFSAVATITEVGRRPELLRNSDGEFLTPSVIYFGEDEPIVGDAAKEMQAFGEKDIASIFKRNIGDPNFVLEFNGRNYTPTDLSAILLSTLKRNAEIALGSPVDQAVITVPAYFNNFQREATIDAGEAAGLKVLRIINEPTAAAIAYGMDRVSDQTLLIYDLGGGTFDVTLVHITAEEIIVIATDGDHELGGKNWDDRIATYLGQRFREEYGTDPLDDAIAFNDLMIACENAKKQLSSRSKARISITHSGTRESYELTRTSFEDMTRDLMERTQSLTNQVLVEAGKSWTDLSGVLLVGGSTRMPMVSDYVESMSGKKPMTGINVDEAVALGAAIQAEIDAGETDGRPMFTLGGRKSTRDVTSHSLGMVAENQDSSQYINSIIIPKNRPIPSVESSPFQLHTSPTRDNELEVYMLQGESETPTDCAILGKYTFTDIPHIKGGLAVIDIEYSYDRNGVVNVSATEHSTGKPLPLRIDPVPEDMSWLDRPPEKQEFVSVHITIYLTIDVSYSMEGPSLKEAKKAAREFVKRSDLAHTSIGLVQFGSRGKEIIAPTQNARKINKAIDSLSVTGSTNMTDGINVPHAGLMDTDDPRIIVLLTDGYPDDRPTTIQAAKVVCDDGIDLITIGTGGADGTFLRQLACSDENSHFAEPGTVVATFSKIAQVLTETGGGSQNAGDGTKKRRGVFGLLKK